MEDRATPIVRRMAKMGDAYQRLVALDDAWWGEQARRGRKGGMLGVKKTREYINSVLHARN